MPSISLWQIVRKRRFESGRGCAEERKAHEKERCQMRRREGTYV